MRGGGILQELGDGVSLSWRDLAVLMIGWSDNEATNVLVRRVGMDAVNARLDGLGLPHTRLRRLMMDLEAARRGDENVSTPREIATARGDRRPGRGAPAGRRRATCSRSRRSPTSARRSAAACPPGSTR